MLALTELSDSHGAAVLGLGEQVDAVTFSLVAHVGTATGQELVEAGRASLGDLESWLEDVVAVRDGRGPRTATLGDATIALNRLAIRLTLGSMIITRLLEADDLDDVAEDVSNALGMARAVALNEGHTGASLPLTTAATMTIGSRIVTPKTGWTAATFVVDGEDLVNTQSHVGADPKLMAASLLAALERPLPLLDIGVCAGCGDWFCGGISGAVFLGDATVTLVLGDRWLEGDDTKWQATRVVTIPRDAYLRACREAAT